ncbi:MAG: cytochrome c biogenesis protein CcsA [Hydrogenimonas sp.]|nr:cytochrome c biogenesis protein CcsA [Hydrogenimonas sp.]
MNMKKFSEYLLSMQSAVALMLIFALSIAVATFIENDYGTQTAKALVYNAKWFEFLLLLLAVNLAANIVRFRMYRAGKLPVFIFHLSFLVILVGAAITRYYGFEGIMHIREGETTNEIVSEQAFVQLEAIKGKRHLKYARPVLFSKIGDNSFKEDISFGDEDIVLEVLNYIPNALTKAVEDPNGKPIISMMVSVEGEPQALTLEKGESFETPSFVISFESDEIFLKPVVAIRLEDGKLYAKLPFQFSYMMMDDRIGGLVGPGDSEIYSRRLYSAEGVSFVIKEAFEHAKRAVVSADKEHTPMSLKGLPDGVELKISYKDLSKRVVVYGKKGIPAEPIWITMGDMRVGVGYGSKIVHTPFYLKLVDFQLERYPGSMSPSSYASEVILIDTRKNLRMPYRIYMNHVLDYDGYRFFQSSYDTDEKGTVLSVNNDPGTLPTYFGYFLLTIGIFGSMLTYSSRFQTLMRRVRDLQKLAKKCASALLLFAAIFAGHDLYASVETTDLPKIDEAHAQKFGELLVQSRDGRIEPVDTLAREVLRKVSRKESLFGMNADQLFLGMIVRPEAWQKAPAIKISNKGINEIIGISPDRKYASFDDFFTGGKNSIYKLGSLVEEISRKRPAERSTLDKEILKVDERVNVLYLSFSGSLLKIFPDPKDKMGRWYAPIDAIKEFDQKNAQFIQAVLASYFSNIDEALEDGNWSRADKALDVIKSYQRFYGAAIIPDENRVKAELFMNRYKPFESLVPLYFGVGFILLFLSIFHIVKPKFNLKWPVRISMALLIAGFFVHTAALGLRWYISGHAPWSNGYESMLYIAWATLLAGFIFSKQSPITVAATGILSGLILFVAHLNWLDPEITNLVPVLKSYWLMIHVSLITASYGFLGLGALLAFITLWLYIIKHGEKRADIEYSIRELTHINEMSLIFGLALLTVGNFMGGVWANESWGRYWGWDPKETWALVTILVYAAVLHLRFYKSFKGIFAFNVASLLAISSVIMTYFGVNYYLSGMHSYAKGDAVPIPAFVYYVVAVVALTIVLAYRKRELLPKR